MKKCSRRRGNVGTREIVSCRTACIMTSGPGVRMDDETVSALLRVFRGQGDSSPVSRSREEHALCSENTRVRATNGLGLLLLCLT